MNQDNEERLGDGIFSHYKSMIIIAIVVLIIIVISSLIIYIFGKDSILILTILAIVTLCFLPKKK